MGQAPQLFQCPACGGPVAYTAPACPRCGARPTGWVAQPTWAAPADHGHKRVAQIVLAVVVVVAVGAYAVTAAKGPSTPPPSPPPTVGTPVAINRDGKLFTVTINSVRESDYPAGSTPRAGYELVSVMVTYKAGHSSEDASYNEWDWSAKAAGHKINTYSRSVDQALGAGDLYADGTASGYVTFEVPKTGEVRVSYWFMSFDSSPTFEVVVRAS